MIASLFVFLAVFQPFVSADTSHKIQYQWQPVGLIEHHSNITTMFYLLTNDMSFFLYLRHSCGTSKKHVLTDVLSVINSCSLAESLSLETPSINIKETSPYGEMFTVSMITILRIFIRSVCCVRLSELAVTIETMSTLIQSCDLHYSSRKLSNTFWPIRIENLIALRFTATYWSGMFTSDLLAFCLDWGEIPGKKKKVCTFFFFNKGEKCVSRNIHVCVCMRSECDTNHIWL